MEATSPKFRKLNPPKLVPPAEVIAKQKEKARALPKNRVLRFFILFFGEGV